MLKILQASLHQNVNQEFPDVQWASRGAPGKSGLHASGEGERIIAPEPW